MNRYLKILILSVLVGGIWSFPILSSGQNIENQNPFFKNEANEKSPPSSPSEPEYNIQNLLEQIIQADDGSQSESEIISESPVENNASIVSEPKNMVKVPDPLPKQKFDAADFEDPFYRVRGFQGDTEKVLQPGTTLDGVQFQNYSDSDKFIEQFYRESGFSMDKVFDKIKYLEKKGGCYTCHQGIEEISSNHRISCVRCHGGNRRAKSLPRAHRVW